MWRRNLGRALSRQSRASVEAILECSPRVSGRARRIGITGNPGAGKSSLIARFAEKRLQRARDIAVIAVDPTSPISDGSLLGDRIRMDAVADEDRLYIRSFPSGRCEDGLCNNIVGLLDTLDRAGFDDIILETVGTGQTNYRAKALVDIFILTLVPDSGDVIQAMKAGIMEVADLYVINKADLPGAQKIASEIGLLSQRRRSASGWVPRIIMTSSRDGRGFTELDEAVEDFFFRAHEMRAADDTEATRRRFQLKVLIEQRVDEILSVIGPTILADVALRDLYERVVEAMMPQARG